ncbi:hypothetical protein GCM10023325_22090 [Sphingomonas lutea]
MFSKMAEAFADAVREASMIIDDRPAGRARAEEANRRTLEHGVIAIQPEPDDNLVVQKAHAGMAIVHDPASATTLVLSLNNRDYTAIASPKASASIPVRLAWWTSEYEPTGARAEIDASQFRKNGLIFVTIDHVYPSTFFPYAEAIYPRELPLDRQAQMLATALRAIARSVRKTSGKLLVLDRREPERVNNQRLAQAEQAQRARRFPSVVDGKNDSGRLLGLDDVDVVIGEPNARFRFDPLSKTVTDARTGWKLSVEERGAGGEKSEVAVIRDGDRLICDIQILRGRGWRADVGATALIEFSRVFAPRTPQQPVRLMTADEMPLDRIAPLLNAYAPWASTGETVGKTLIADLRAQTVGTR